MDGVTSNIQTQIDAVQTVTINNNADNRLITGSGTAQTINGEANLLFGATPNELEIRGQVGTLGYVPTIVLTDIDHTNTFAEINQGDGRLNLIARNNTTNGSFVFVGNNGTTTTTYGGFDASGNFEIGTTDVIDASRNVNNLESINMADSKIIKLGTGLDLQIYHNGTNSFINNDTGDLFIKNFANDEDIVFQCDDGSGGVATYFQLDGSQAQSRFLRDAQFDDSVQLKIGSSGDMSIQHNGTDSKITNNTGTLEFRQNVDDGDITFRSDDGSGGTAEYFRLDGGDQKMYASRNIQFFDNVKGNFGTSADLQIYHNGTDSFIDDAGSGDLRIRSNFLKIEKYTGETMATFNDDNSVALYFNNSKKFETTSSGIDVTGSATLDTFASIQGVDTGNPSAGTDEIRVSGYGIMGNRGGFYVTNADTGGNIQFGIGGVHAAATKMYIASGGNVGIGDTTPSQKLDVNGNIGIGGTEVISSSRNLLNIGSITASGKTISAGFETTQANTAFNILSRNSVSTAVYIQQAGSGNILDVRYGSAAAGSGTSALLVDGSGNVGIGTTSPSEKLSIAPDTDVSAEIGKAHVGYIGHSNYAGFSHVDTNTTSDYALLQSESGQTFLNAKSTSSGINFRIGNSEKMKLDSSGRLLIGQTSSNGDKLEVQGNANVFAARLNGSTTGGQSYGLRIRAGTNSTDKGLLIENTGGTDLFAVCGDGTIDIAGTQILDQSRNLTNIGTISSGAITSTGVSIESATANLTLKDTSDDDDHQIYFKDNGGTVRYQITSAGDQFNFATDGSREIVFKPSNTEKFRIGTAYNESKQDIRITTGGLRIGSITVIDSSRNLLNINNIDLTSELNFTGNSSKYIDFHTLANSNSINLRHHNPTGNLFETAAVFNANGGGIINYDGSARMTTQSAGIKVNSAAVGGVAAPILNVGQLNNAYQSGMESSVHLTMKTYNPSGNFYFYKQSNILASIIDGDFCIGQTAVIDSSRNLTNIASANIGGGTSYFSEKLLVEGLTRFAHGSDGVEIAFGTGYSNHGILRHDDQNFIITMDRTSGTGNINLTPYENVNITTGALEIGGISVISANRNLLNIGTLTNSGTITSTGSDHTFYSGGSTQSLAVGRLANQSIKIEVTDNNNIIQAFQDSDSNGNHYFDLRRDFEGTGSNLFRIRKGTNTQIEVDGDGDLNVADGDLKMNGQVVITNARALTNISTISSGAITGQRGLNSKMLLD